jgi:hypothetical protein
VTPPVVVLIGCAIAAAAILGIALVLRGKS